jgi:hypothetical protein
MTTISRPAQAVAQPEQREEGKTERPKSATRAAFAAVPARVKAGTPVLVWTAVIRAGTALADYMLVMVTAVSVIPMIGAYLHQRSGTSLGSPTASATIAVWLVPFLFVVVALAVAEIAFMRWLWRAGSGRIASLKHARRSTPEKVADTETAHRDGRPTRKTPARNRR